MRSVVSAALLTMSVAIAACSSTTDDVCTDIGDCAQGGSSAWVESCESEANSLQQEAQGAGCGQEFTSYYSCANNSFQCQGATATFPGCDTARSALDRCLATSEASTSCAKLAAAEAACGGGPAGGVDAGVDAGEDAGATIPVVPPACTAARDCEAACYLADVSNVCAPRVDELQALASCSASCPAGP